MKRLFHVCGFTVPRKVKRETFNRSVALYILNEDNTVRFLGIVNSVTVVNGVQAFALSKCDIRRLGNGTFSIAYEIVEAHKTSRLVAFDVSGDTEAMAKAVLERLQFAASADCADPWTTVPVSINRSLGLNTMLPDC